MMRMDQNGLGFCGVTENQHVKAKKTKIQMTRFNKMRAKLKF